MLVSFLDFDDVLNSYSYFSGTKVQELKQLKRFSQFEDHERLDEKAVKIYNNFVKRTNAKTIISSNWRHYHSTEELTRLLRKVGFEGDVIGKTPSGTNEIDLDLLERYRLRGTIRWRTGSFPFCIRGHLIFQRVIEMNLSPEQIVIFDDRDDMNPLESRLIQTEETEGLTEAHIEQAYRLLGLT